MLDDLESCFWVLLYVSLIHFELEAGDPDLDIFNEYSERMVAGKFHSFGGQGKYIVISNNELLKYKWKSEPLDRLIRTLASMLGDLITLRSRASVSPQAQEQLKAFEDQLRTADPFLRMFNEALALDNWVNDRRAAPVERTTKKQAEQKRLADKTKTLATGQGQPSKFKTSAAGPSRRPSLSDSGSSHSSTKRPAEDAAENVEEKRKVMKRARTEMPPRKDPEQPLGQPAVGEHRYPTRSKTKTKTKSNGSKGSKSAPKKSLPDVVMQEVSHRYGLRSRTKAKENPAPPPAKATGRTTKKPTKQPAPKQSEKRARTNKRQGGQNSRPPWR